MRVTDNIILPTIVLNCFNSHFMNPPFIQRLFLYAASPDQGFLFHSPLSLVLVRWQYEGIHTYILSRQSIYHRCYIFAYPFTPRSPGQPPRPSHPIRQCILDDFFRSLAAEQTRCLAAMLEHKNSQHLVSKSNPELLERKRTRETCQKLEWLRATTATHSCSLDTAVLVTTNRILAVAVFPIPLLAMLMTWPRRQEHLAWIQTLGRTNHPSILLFRQKETPTAHCVYRRVS